jgi:hypothetical protein
MYLKNTIFKNMFSHFFILLFCTYPTTHGMEQDKRAKDAGSNIHAFIKSVLIGSGAGAAEVVVNQPTVFFKNALQQQKDVFSLVKESPGLLYEGLGVNAVCMIPTTAAQIAVSTMLKGVMPDDDLKTAAARNALAGASSALLSNPSELVIINQQNRRTNARDTARNLYRQHGMSVGLRGYIAKAGRDSVFCSGFLTAYPAVKEKIKQSSGLDGFASGLAATAVVGPVTAVVSHPFDTISTRMQADASKKQFQGFFDTAKQVCKKEGVQSLLAGLLPRKARILVAIPLMSGVSAVLEKKLENNIR